MPPTHIRIYPLNLIDLMRSVLVIMSNTYAYYMKNVSLILYYNIYNKYLYIYMLK